MSMETERALLIEIRAAHILAQALCPERWREMVKVARVQAEEELDFERKGDDGPHE